MIEFKTNYTEKSINITPDNNFNYELVNQYGPWVATVSNKADMDLFIASPEMAEYMMARAKILDQIINTIHANGMLSPTRHEEEELKTILVILKIAGIEVVEKMKHPELIDVKTYTSGSICGVEGYTIISLPTNDSSYHK